MADTVDAPPRVLPYVTFSAANDATTLLFELIQVKASPPNLFSDGTSIGFQLSLPLSSDALDQEALETASTASGVSSTTGSDSDLSSTLMQWDVGAGRSPAMVDKGLGGSNPPVLLCPPGATLASKAVRKHIKDVHARVFLHPTSGVLMLKALCNRPIVYEKGDINDDDLELRLDEYGHGMTCVLRREYNYICIGPYRFLLKFAAQSRETYRSFTAHMNTHMGTEYHGLVPSRLFNLIPMASPHDDTKWNVWFHRQIPTTNLMAGVNILTGQPLAIKRLSNKGIAHKRRDISHQLRTALRYSDRQESGILGVLDMWCDHQTSCPCLFDASSQSRLKACRQTYVSMPLASYSFLDAPWMRLGFRSRLLLCHQTLLGLAELHGQEVFHGNIRPGSLLLVGNTTRNSRPDSQSLAAQKAVLSFSTSSVLEEPLSKTAICVAPEVWRALDRGITGDHNETKLDIWALACSWLYAFTTPAPRKITTMDDHLWLQTRLCRTVGLDAEFEPFSTLWRQMVAWNPQDRPTAAEALASEAWQLVWTETQKEANVRKQKRKARLRSDGAKRVRVLSPEEEDYTIF